MRVGGRTALALGAGVLVGALLTVGIAAARPGADGADRPSAADVAAPRTVPVVRQVLEDVEVVAGALTWAEVEEPVLRDGVVTAMPVQHGDELVPGTVVVELDDRPVVALHLPFGLWRDLRDGDEGSDVRHLHVALGELGLYPADVDAPLGLGTRQALAALDPRLGQGDVLMGDVVAVDLTGSVLSAPAVSIGHRIGVQEGTIGVRKRTDRVAVDDAGGVAQYARPGHEIRFGDTDGAPVWSGTIAAVEVAGSRTLLTLDRSDDLPVELVTASVVLDRTETEVLTLPRVALVPAPDGSSSVVVADAGAGPDRRLSIRTGLCTGELCEIVVDELDGGELGAGDAVVVA